MLSGLELLNWEILHEYGTGFIEAICSLAWSYQIAM